MPITILPLPPNTHFGPGLWVSAQTDLIGPLTTAATWTLNLSTNSDVTNAFYSVQLQSQNNPTAFLPFTRQGPEVGVLENQPVAETPTFAHVELTDSGTTDTGTTGPVPWDTTSGLGVQAQQLSFQAQGSGGGFTDADRTTLQTVQAWTALDTFITSLATTDLGTSPVGGTIAAELPDWVYGVIIRITQIDPVLVAQTPDLDYYVKTLAVLRVFRGTDILSRVPIHRSSQIVPFTGNGMALQIAGIGVQLWAPGLSLEVDFAENCAGQVLLMKLP